MLESFYKKTQPGGPGWQKVVAKSKDMKIQSGEGKWTVPYGILAMLVGCVLIYSIMFATGYYIYGEYNSAIPLTVIAVGFALFLVRLWKNIKAEVL